MTTTKQYPAASVRNSAPIFDVLKNELGPQTTVFEIGSGSGCHALHFCQQMPGWHWQPSELAALCPALSERMDGQQPDNLRQPVIADAADPATFAIHERRYDVVYSCNTLHIMPFSAVQTLWAGIDSLLSNTGRFVYYGPFHRDGAATTDSNAAFDAQLKGRGTGMGIRDLESINELAAGVGLGLQRLYAMPANNLLGIWQRSTSE